MIETPTVLESLKFGDHSADISMAEDNYILTIYMHCNTMYAEIYSKGGMLSPLS